MRQPSYTGPGGTYAIAWHRPETGATAEERTVYTVHRILEDGSTETVYDGETPLYLDSLSEAVQEAQRWAQCGPVSVET